MKTLLVLLLSYHLYGGYQLELPLNKRVMIGFTAPYIKDELSYSKNFPYIPSKKYIAISKTRILDALDMNLSDNNLSLIYSNKFKISSIQKYNNYDYGDVTINISNYDITTGSYKLYSSKNSSSSNTLKYFEAGKGYYIFISTTNLNRKIGLISSSNFSLGEHEHSTPKDGWYMMNLNDDLLSQSSSAIFIPFSTQTISISSVNKEFQFQVSINTSARQSTRAINHQIRMQMNKGYPMHMSAYPTKEIRNSIETEGILIISDSFIETSSLNAISVTHRSLGFNRRSLQESMLAFKFSNETLPYPSKLSIVNSKNKKEDVILSPNETINQHLSKISSKLSSLSIEPQSYGVYKIDGDFNSSSTDFEYIFLALDNSFGIKEALSIQSYKKTADDGRFQIRGRVTRRVNKISDIPNMTNDTKIYYYDRGNDIFDIASNEVENIAILEENSNVLSPVKTTSKGYISEFFKDINIFNFKSKNNYDNILDTNEGYRTFIQPYYKDLTRKYSYSKSINLSQTLLHFSNLGYKILSLYTLNISQKSWNYTTIDNMSRLTNMSKQPAPIGSIYKEKAYFLNLKKKKPTTIKILDFKKYCSISTHFNNSEEYKTTNDVSCKYSFYTNSLKNSGGLYSAIAIVNNIVYELVANNGKFSFNVNSQNIDLLDDQDYDVNIAILDNYGNQVFQKAFVFPYKKPNPPMNMQTKKVFISKNTIIYKTYISDIDEEKNKLGVGLEYLLSPDLSWDSLGGKSIDLVAVNKNSNNLYSDIVKFKYYAFENKNTDFVSDTKKINKFIQFNNYVDDIKLYFKSMKNISFIGISKVMYLRAGDDLVASVVYNPKYSGSMFYVAFNGLLYKGVFERSEKYSSDSTPYFMTKIEN